jgi:hypothetical protein
MAKDQITLDAGTITGRGNTLNPFIILEGAAGFITFAEEVLDAREVAEARIPTPTGKLIHAELRVGDSLVLLADAQEGWRTHFGMFQIWTSDVLRITDACSYRGPVGQSLVGVPARSGATRPEACVGRWARHHFPYHRRVHALHPLSDRITQLQRLSGQAGSDAGLPGR